MKYKTENEHSVSTLLKAFETKGILKEVTGYQRNKNDMFIKYLEVYSQS